VSNATVNRTLEVVRAILRKKINLSRAFAGQRVGVKQVEEKIWLVSFMRYDSGFFDDQCSRVECAPNPFSAKVSAMCPV
jgi:putative transposase